MTDPLIPRYLPVLRGYVAKKYGWLETRGHCLITVDDLIQVASIALLRHVERWDDFLAERGLSREDREDGHGGMFWVTLEEDVKRAIYRYRHRDNDDDDLPSSFDDKPADYENNADEFHTAIKVKGDGVLGALYRDQVVDIFEVMSTRDKTAIALRYFDELKLSSVAELFGLERTALSQHLRTVRTEWLGRARNLFIDRPAIVKSRRPLPWEPSEVLLTYIRDRHRKDIHEYLWYVTECFRRDVSYLVEILGPKATYVPTSHEEKHIMSPFQKQCANELLAEGLSNREIGRRLGFSNVTIGNHFKRRTSI